MMQCRYPAIAKNATARGSFRRPGLHTLPQRRVALVCRAEVSAWFYRDVFLDTALQKRI